MAWETMRTADSMMVTPKPFPELFSSSMRPVTVVVLAILGAIQLGQDNKESLLTQLHLFVVSYCRTAPTWTSVQHTVAEYFHCTYLQSLFSSLPNALVFGHHSNVIQAQPGAPTASSVIIEFLFSGHDDVKRIPAAPTSSLRMGPSGSAVHALHVSYLSIGSTQRMLLFFNLRFSIYRSFLFLKFRQYLLRVLFLAASPAALPCASSPLVSVLLTLSAVALIGPASSNTASLYRGLLQYLCKWLAQRKAIFAKLDSKQIRRMVLVTPLEARLADMQAPFTAFRMHCETLRAANDDLLETQTTVHQKSATLSARVFELRSDLKASRASPSDLSGAIRDRDCYEVLLKP